MVDYIAHNIAHNPISDEDFDAVFRLMDVSFPLTELRTKEGQKGLLRNPAYHLIVNNKAETAGKIIAVMAIWEVADFLFLEHFALDPAERGRGLGQEMLQHLLATTNKQVILEVELPEDELCRRRIGFYERHGFVLNDYDYMQPPLRVQNPYIPLRIMSSGKVLEENVFLQMRESLYCVVYGI